MDVYKFDVVTFYDDFSNNIITVGLLNACPSVFCLWHRAVLAQNCEWSISPCRYFAEVLPVTCDKRLRPLGLSSACRIPT